MKKHNLLEIAFIYTWHSHPSFVPHFSSQLFNMQSPRLPLMLRNLLGILIDMRAGLPLAAWDESRVVAEELVHVLQIEPLGLGLERPEEQGIAEVANDEDEVELPSDRGDGDGRDLTDHRVEGEGGHGAPGDTFQAHGRAEEFGGNGPAERAAGPEEHVVEQPGEHHEGPMSSRVGGRSRVEFDDYSVDDERQA